MSHPKLDSSFFFYIILTKNKIDFFNISTHLPISTKAALLLAFLPFWDIFYLYFPLLQLPQVTG